MVGPPAICCRNKDQERRQDELVTSHAEVEVRSKIVTKVLNKLLDVTMRIAVESL
jgi:hypothetical protein